MIEVSHLTRYYGDFLAVDDLSFEIGEGHVYGFLGPNGAGKSTTMNIMTGCLSATEGKVLIDGCDIFETPAEAKKRIGYLPEQPPLYMNDTPLEYLRFVGQAKGLKGGELEKQIDTVVEQTKIGAMKNRRIAALSKGYRQRVGIAQALLGNPRVIILDEPTVGLDPIQIIEIRDLIRELGKSHTVLFSSHILSEVQALCDQILILSKGKLVAFDDPASLEKRLHSSNEIAVTAETSPEEAREILQGVPHVGTIQVSGENGLSHASVRPDSEDLQGVSRDIFFAFAARQKALLELGTKRANLEEVFLELTESDEEIAPKDISAAANTLGGQNAPDGQDALAAANGQGPQDGGADSVKKGGE